MSLVSSVFRYVLNMAAYMILISALIDPVAFVNLGEGGWGPRRTPLFCIVPDKDNTKDFDTRPLLKSGQLSDLNTNVSEIFIFIGLVP